MKIKVPEDRVDRVAHAVCEVAKFNALHHLEKRHWQAILDGFAQDLAENPIVPTDAEVADIVAAKPESPSSWNWWQMAKHGAVEWQRCMFQEPETEAPEASEIDGVAMALAESTRARRGLKRKWLDLSEEEKDNYRISAQAGIAAYNRGRKSV